MNDSLHVTVRFGDKVPPNAEGPALLALEKYLRAFTSLDIRVFKERMGDDSKLRVMMSKAERDRL